MGLATFVAIDPYAPAATGKEIDVLLSKMSGVVDWRMHARGDITVEYRNDVISDQLIEAALVGVGFRLKHVCSEPEAVSELVKEALDR